MNACKRTRSVLLRLVTDDDGQDLVEYALLTGIVAVVAAIALPVASQLGAIYQGWNTSVHDLWEAPPPSGGGGGGG
jgi:Flp pilus assembly pilin Flp